MNHAEEDGTTRPGFLHEDPTAYSGDQGGQNEVGEGCCPVLGKDDREASVVLGTQRILPFGLWAVCGWVVSSLVRTAKQLMLGVELS